MHDFTAVSRALWIVHEQLEKAVVRLLATAPTPAAIASVRDLAAISADLSGQLSELTASLDRSHPPSPTRH